MLVISNKYKSFIGINISYKKISTFERKSTGHPTCMSKRIKNILHKALLLNGKMEHALYEYELKEHLDYWKKGLVKDDDEFVFVVTENKGDVAMILITNKGKLFINEKARQQLQLYWKGVYENNIEFLLPSMAKQLSDGILPVNGVKYAIRKQPAITSKKKLLSS